MDEGSLWGLVGIVASVTVVLSWVPQVVRIWTTKSAEDISVGLPLLMLLGSTLWGTYGLHLNDPIIVTVNIAVFSFNVLLLLLKRRYGGTKAQVVSASVTEEGR